MVRPSPTASSDHFHSSPFLDWSSLNFGILLLPKSCANTRDGDEGEPHDVPSAEHDASSEYPLGDHSPRTAEILGISPPLSDDADRNAPELDELGRDADGVRDGPPLGALAAELPIRGQIEGVLGNPPVDDARELMAKQLLLWTVARQGAAMHGFQLPYFALGATPASSLWKLDMWDAFRQEFHVPMVQFESREAASNYLLATNLALRGNILGLRGC